MRNNVKKDILEVLHKTRNFKLVLGSISTRMKNFEVSLVFEDDPDYYKQNYEMDLKMAAAFSYYNNLPMEIRSVCGSDDLISSVDKKNYMVSSSVGKLK